MECRHLYLFGRHCNCCGRTPSVRRGQHQWLLHRALREPPRAAQTFRSSTTIASFELPVRLPRWCSYRYSSFWHCLYLYRPTLARRDPQQQQQHRARCWKRANVQPKGKVRTRLLRTYLVLINSLRSARGRTRTCSDYTARQMSERYLSTSVMTTAEFRDFQLFALGVSL